MIRTKAGNLIMFGELGAEVKTPGAVRDLDDQFGRTGDHAALGS